MSSLYIFWAILNQLRKRVLCEEEELWETRHNIHIIINTIPEFIYEEEEEALVCWLRLFSLPRLEKP